MRPSHRQEGGRPAAAGHRSFRHVVCPPRTASPAFDVRRRLLAARSSGELFPLPMPRRPGSPIRGPAPRYAVRRSTHRALRHERACDAVWALNQLAVATAGAGPGNFGQASDFGPRQPTPSQRSSLTTIYQRVAACGRPPDDLDEHRAIDELMASRSLYGQEPANIAHYRFEHLKVNRGSVLPRDPRPLLPADARGLLDHYDTQIELSAEHLAERLREPLPKPYWDTTLRTSKAERRRLLLHLAKQRLIGFRHAVKAKAGLFFVKKKLGADGIPWIRLVVDARQACACHQRPPKVFLGSSRAISEIDMSTETLEHLGGCGGVAELPIFAADTDVNDSFYNFSVPQLGSWFGLDHGYTAADLRAVGIYKVFDDSTQDYVAVSDSVTYWAAF